MLQMLCTVCFSLLCSLLWTKVTALLSNMLLLFMFLFFCSCFHPDIIQFYKTDGGLMVLFRVQTLGYNISTSQRSNLPDLRGGGSREAFIFLNFQSQISVNYWYYVKELKPFWIFKSRKKALKMTYSVCIEKTVPSQILLWTIAFLLVLY